MTIKLLVATAVFLAVDSFGISESSNTPIGNIILLAQDSPGAAPT